MRRRRGADLRGVFFLSGDLAGKIWTIVGRLKVSLEGVSKFHEHKYVNKV